MTYKNYLIYLLLTKTLSFTVSRPDINIYENILKKIKPS